MAVDDHAINSLKVWFDIAHEDLKRNGRAMNTKSFLIVRPLKQPIPIEKL